MAPNVNYAAPKMKKRFTALIIGSFFGTSLAASVALAETSNAEANHTIAREPDKVYVENDYGTYKGTRSDDYCFFNDEHQHIHCYEEDPQRLSDRVVVVENRTTRSTRRHYDPVATGIGVGIAIGLPILVHHAVHDRHYYGSRYQYRNNRYRNDRYRNDHRRNDRYRNDHRRNDHSRSNYKRNKHRSYYR